MCTRDFVLTTVWSVVEGKERPGKADQDLMWVEPCLLWPCKVGHGRVSGKCTCCPGDAFFKMKKGSLSHSEPGSLSSLHQGQHMHRAPQEENSSDAEHQVELNMALP